MEAGAEIDQPPHIRRSPLDINPTMTTRGKRYPGLDGDILVIRSYDLLQSAPAKPRALPIRGRHYTTDALGRQPQSARGRHPAVSPGAIGKERGQGTLAET